MFCPAFLCLVFGIILTYLGQFKLCSSGKISAVYSKILYYLKKTCHQWIPSKSVVPWQTFTLVVVYDWDGKVFEMSLCVPMWSEMTPYGEVVLASLVTSMASIVCSVWPKYCMTYLNWRMYTFLVLQVKLKNIVFKDPVKWQKSENKRFGKDLW